MKSIAITVVVGLLFATGLKRQESRAPTGREQVCINRCEAKGWPRGCFEQCMRQWR